MKKLTTIQKVAAGFTLMTAILAAAVALTLWQVSRTQAVTQQLVNQSAPMSLSSLRVINGVNYSVSQLRGWILLDDPMFKTNRALAWSESIEPSRAELKRLVEEYGTAKQREQIAFVDGILDDMKASQAEAEAVARTSENLPALKLTLAEAGPKGAAVLAAAAVLMEAESRQELAADRQPLLADLAAFQSSFAQALAALHAFVASGEAVHRQDYQSLRQQSDEAFAQLDARAVLTAGAEAQTWAKLKRLHAEFLTLAEQVMALRNSDQANVAVAIVRDRGTPKTRQARQTLETFIAELEPRNQANRDELVERTAYLTTMEWLLLVVGIALGAGLALIIGRSVRRSIADVQQSTQEVRSASHEVAAGAQQQVASLNETAASLNEITATAEEFKATMQEFADRARAVQEAADETAKQSVEGRALTQESAARISQVRTNSQAAGESALKLAEQMQRIGEITASVNEIADQTKLLALNASIEAARAGEEGRGFAVVATQVRELANQSKEAARRIESLISGTQKSMQEVVQKIEHGSRLSEESTEIVRRMSVSFEDISRAIQLTTSAMGQINTGAKQQEAGISQLVRSITEIDGASKESLCSAEQTQKAILSIDEQIRRLDQTMSAF